jgi:hypothetical protein
MKIFLIIVIIFLVLGGSITIYFVERKPSGSGGKDPATKADSTNKSTSSGSGSAGNPSSTTSSDPFFDPMYDDISDIVDKEMMPSSTFGIPNNP